ncbi:MAG: nucleotide exchange factor GrpE [Verrucomicrobiaceae bacterium]|nr:MAG: nucleotide exchange factor GrpE [Verrucomicrobiaceae bacterium]
MYDEVESPEPDQGGESDEWKQRLRQQVDEWLREVGEIPAPEEEADHEEPDLYSLYAELLALRNDSRKANRKTAETFSQFGESLGNFESETKRLREQLSRMESVQAKGDELPRSHCLALVEMLDRLHRLRAAMERRPETSRIAFFGSTRSWEEAWEKLRQGFSILLTHFEALTKSSGVQPMLTLNTPFDPLEMVAVATEPAGGRAPNIVTEEISVGYRWRNEVLRPAEVKITTNRS